MRSDRAVAAQLEEVVAAFQPDEAILVTDGAEDESVLPNHPISSANRPCRER